MGKTKKLLAGLTAVAVAVSVSSVTPLLLGASSVCDDCGAGRGEPAGTVLECQTNANHVHGRIDEGACTGACAGALTAVCDSDEHVGSRVYTTGTASGIDDNCGDQSGTRGMCQGTLNILFCDNCNFPTGNVGGTCDYIADPGDGSTCGGEISIKCSDCSLTSINASLVGENCVATLSCRGKRILTCAKTCGDAEGDVGGACTNECGGAVEAVPCTNSFHNYTPPGDNTNIGGGETAASGGGSVVADMIAGGGIGGGGGGGTNNTESGGGKEAKVIADSAEAKLAVGNATRGTVTLSPDMGATSDVLEALTTVGANVKVWIPHGTHGVAIKGSDLGEGELKDLSFKGGAVAVPERIKSNFPDAKSVTGMGFVESGDFGGVDQVMLSVRLDLDPKLWGSVIKVYSVEADGSLTLLPASRIVGGFGTVNVTISNYNSLIFVVE